MIRGTDGDIGTSSCFVSPTNVAFINQGAIAADVNGGNIILDATWTNGGIIQASNGRRLIAHGVATNAGQLNPETAPGILNLTGNYAQDAIGILDIDSCLYQPQLP